MSNWQERAACRGVSTELFYPEGNGGDRRALAFCARCPVRVECLDDAIARENGPRSHRFGVRGGMTAAGRHREAQSRIENDWSEVERSWFQWRQQRDRFEMFNEEWAVPA